MNRWAILLPIYAYLTVNFLFGYYSSRHVSRAPNFLQEYFLGNRDLNGFVLAMTLFGTYVSASSFIGGPGMAYSQGLGWVLLAMTQVSAGYIGLSMLGKKFAIVGRKIKAVTIIDFLRERYRHEAVALLASVSIVVFLFASMTAQWVGGARLLQAAAGMEYGAGLAIFALTVMVYVTIGGFRAATLLDSVQGSIMLAGTVAVLAGTIIAGGGITNIMATLRRTNPDLLTPFGVNGFIPIPWISSYWILVGLGTAGLPQLAVRAMAYKNSRAMHQGIVLNTFVVGFTMLGMHLAGVLGRAVIPGEKTADLVMPTLTATVLNPWLAGFVLAAPLAAIMSTVDSVLILVSSAIIKDIYLSYFNPSAGERLIRRVSLSATAILGVAVFLAAMTQPPFLVWLNLWSLGGLEAAFLVPILAGLYWKRANATGALAGMVTGISTYVAFDRFWNRPFGTHTIVLPLVLATLAMVVGSWTTRAPDADIVERFWGA
ncbi:MAG: sodium/pantothenate symporter [Ignavibacteriales bacterium]